MSDEFRRLVDSDLDPRVQKVLASGLGDGPSPEAVKTAAAALGISAGAATVAQVAASKPTLTLLVLKWLGIGVVAGMVTSTAALTLSAKEEAPPRVVQVAPPAATAVHVASPQVEQAAPVPSAEPPPAPRAAFAAAEPSAEPAPGPSVASFAAPSDKSSLSREIALLDEARRALRTGNPGATLAALDRYDAASTSHALGAEALLLRVRALAQAGRHGEARALAQRYIDRHPGDGYSVKLARIVGLEK